MSTNTYYPQVVTMKELKHLFIEMTEKCCNQKCKYCYIDFPQYKKVEDYIDINTIKSALVDTKADPLECIYLTGAEPMTHPDFNSILRLCLKRSNVCICTNGSFINEKKARFLRKVEDESSYEILFKLSLNHFDEVKNDDVRYRGAFRDTLFALKHLTKYNFNSIISFANFYELSTSDINSGMLKVLKKNNIELEFSNIEIVPWTAQTDLKDIELAEKISATDCMCGRTITNRGVYTCPFLANDYRGRCGSTLQDYNKKCNLETQFCKSCIKAKKTISAINFSHFE